MAAGRRRGLAAAAAAALLLALVAGAAAQDAYPFRDFPNPVPYAPFSPLEPVRSRPFPRDVQHQSSFQQQPFQAQGFQQQSFPPSQGFQPQPFQGNKFSPAFQPLPAFNASNALPFGLGSFGGKSPRGNQQADFPQFFQDPQFEQLFHQELNHQIQLEQQRLQDQPFQQQQQQQQRQNQQPQQLFHPPPPSPQQQQNGRPQPSFQIQQSHSVQVERPQLQELHELHSLLEQQLQHHEVRQKEELQQRQQQQMLQQMIRQQQQQQQLQQQQLNLVDSHEQFMSQKIKAQPSPSPPRRPQVQHQQQQQQKQQQQQQQQLKPAKPSTTTTPRAPLEVIDLNQLLPFLKQQQQLQQQLQLQSDKEKEKEQDGGRLQQQRQRQQQRQQETLRQQEENRLQELRLRERQRQQRQQVQQQARQEQERRQRAQNQQRPQRQQPAPTGANNNKGNKTEKPVTSVRDLFNTTSCIEPPLTCPHPRIHFYLYTRTTQENGDRVDVTRPESLLSTPFNPKHPIKVLIHGFQGGRQYSPSTDLRKAYFIRGDYNIFVVDYNSLVRLPCLSQIQWSPSFLALCVSQLVNYVGTTTKELVSPDRFHLIGYSIGAHIAGLVANYIERGKLGRITGLDPTIIFYQGTNRSHDLDPSDAHFIDVIHTGAGILGQRGPNGHVDYYVNGGTTQPGCQSDSLIKTLSCDHTKVSPYYVESIVTPVGFWALPCPNLFMYLLGFCQPKDEDYIIMGEDAPHTARGIYYLSTNANKPFAKGFPGKRMPIKFPKWRAN